MGSVRAAVDAGVLSAAVVVCGLAADEEGAIDVCVSDGIVGTLLVRGGGAVAAAPEA